MPAPAARSTAAAALRGVRQQPYVLLVLTMLAWAGNAVASRLAVGEISPMVLVAGRWAVVLTFLLLATRRQIAERLPMLRPQWRAIFLMGAAGYTAFNALFYLAGHHTSAVNISILQGSMPVFVLLGALGLFHTPIRAGQGLGIVISLAGVAVIASQGDLLSLLGLKLNLGDGFMLVACILYAGYTLALRGRPGASSIAFFAGLAAAAFVTSLPLLAVEILSGAARWPTAQGWAIVAYVAVAPSFLAQLAYMRAVELIGPGRAGLFINLVPVFGALLAVVILAEPFRPHQAVALALVLAGILLSERSGRPERDA